MYKISVLLPLLFLGALAFPKNRGEDGNKISFLGALNLIPLLWRGTSDRGDQPEQMRSKIY